MGALIGWGPGDWFAASGSFQSQAAVPLALADIVLRNEELQSARKCTWHAMHLSPLSEMYQQHVPTAPTACVIYPWSIVER